MKLLSFAVVVALALLVGGCGQTAPGEVSRREEKSGPLVVAVSIPPQKFFVDRIAGDRAETLVMVPGGAFPHTYEPKPQQLATLAEADVYFAIGVPFEKTWLDRLQGTNPTLPVVRTDANLTKRVMMEPHVCEEGHDHSAHGEGAEDPHLWLAPQHALAQAEVMLQTFVKLDPEGTKEYVARFEALKGEIDSLNAELAQVLAGEEGRAFFVYHPSWGYFADAYGLQQIPVEVNGKEPGPQDLKLLIDLARERGVTTIFVQPQTAARGAMAIAEAVGAEVVSLDPLDENWNANMRKAANAIAAAAR